MIGRGRLIHKFKAEIARLDTAATETAGGFDHDFKTVKTVYNQGVRESMRKEKDPIRVLCQIEPTTWEDQRQTEAGNAPSTMITLCFLYVTLERMGLVDPTTKNPLLNENDRLVAIYDKKDKLVQTMPPHVYARRVDLGSGWLGDKRNILLVTFESRAQGLAG